MNKIVAYIPVRGGSKSIPKKNIKQLAGKPLVYWTAMAASGCPEIEVVYVATDDAEIARVVRDLKLPKVEVIGRSVETATDTASTESALLEFANRTPCDWVVLIQATSPLLTSDDISGGIFTFIETKCDSLLSTVEQKRFIWHEGSDHFVRPGNYDPLCRPLRQFFSGYLVENGAFYIMSREGLLKSKNRLHGNVATWKMGPASFIEIDEPEDWEYIEHELKGRPITEGELKRRLGNIKLVLTDVDGVLTDAGMYYSETGDEVKKFNTRDGKGFELLRLAGMQTGIITAEETQIVACRADKLQIDYLYQGVLDKAACLEEILGISNLDLSQVAYIGDDLGDVSILEMVGLSACPQDADECARSVAQIHLKKSGGCGAFREFAEFILEHNV